MKITNENIEALHKRVEDANIQKREAARELRRAQRKQEQHRYYVIGEIVVTKCFPELTTIAPGNKKENAERFGQFEIFLQAVASDERWRELYLNSLPDNGKKQQHVNEQLQGMKSKYG